MECWIASEKIWKEKLPAGEPNTQPYGLTATKSGKHVNPLKGLPTES